MPAATISQNLRTFFNATTVSNAFTVPYLKCETYFNSDRNFSMAPSSRILVVSVLPATASQRLYDQNNTAEPGGKKVGGSRERDALLRKIVCALLRVSLAGLPCTCPYLAWELQQEEDNVCILVLKKQRG